MAANKNRELKPDLPGLDDTLEFRSKQSKTYSLTKMRRESIIEAKKFKPHLLIEHGGLSPSFQATQRCQESA